MAKRQTSLLDFARKEKQPGTVLARRADTDAEQQDVLMSDNEEIISECCSKESSSDTENADQTTDQSGLCGADCCSDRPNQPTSKLVLRDLKE